MAVKRGKVQSRQASRAGQPKGYTGTTRKIARYGWKRDLPDQRDHSFAVSSDILQTISPSVDLRSQCPPVYDQGRIGSCTANAIAAALEFDMMKQGMTAFTPSRLGTMTSRRTSSLESTQGLESLGFADC